MVCAYIFFLFGYSMCVTIDLITSAMYPYGPANLPCGIFDKNLVNVFTSKGMFSLFRFLIVLLYSPLSLCFYGPRLAC